MKIKKIIIVALLIIMIILLGGNKSFADIYGIVGNGWRLQINTNNTAEENFNNNDELQWAYAIQEWIYKIYIYFQATQINDPNLQVDGSIDLLDNMDRKGIEILKELYYEGYVFPKLSRQQQNSINSSINVEGYYIHDIFGQDYNLNNGVGMLINNLGYYEQALNNNNNNNSNIGTDTTPETQKHTLSEIISNANNFLTKGENGAISSENLRNMSSTIYNVLFILGTIAAFIIGGILGIKFITSGLEGKAEVKEMLLPYIIGCIVLFGSFTIWQLVVNILKSI